jgi:hypothetical protein
VSEADKNTRDLLAVIETLSGDKDGLDVSPALKERVKALQKYAAFLSVIYIKHSALW